MKETHQMPPRPVYIDPHEQAHVRVEGPALCIQIPGQAAYWLPLKRISRITLSEKVSVETPAMLACAARGITLIIHDYENQRIARLVGRGAIHSGLRQRLTDLAERPDWKERYANWHTAIERRIATTVGRRLNTPSNIAINPKRLRKWLAHCAAQAVGPQHAAFTQRIYQRQSLAWMQHHLVRLGVDADSELWLVGFPNLAEDLGLLLALRMEPARLGWLRAIARSSGRERPMKEKMVIRKTEALRGRMDRLGLDIINRLYTWLVEIS